MHMDETFWLGLKLVWGQWHGSRPHLVGGVGPHISRSCGSV